MKWLSLETSERKNVALWMVSTNLEYVFWLAIMAHIQIFSIMCGFIAQLVKRRISAGKDGVSITDEGVTPEERQENV